MGSFSDYLELEILDHIFKVGSYTVPSNLYVALCKSTISDSHTGTTLPNEVTGGAYERKSHNTWKTAASGATHNSGAITFATATAAWGIVTDFAICDKTTNGNVIAYGALSTSKNIGNGDTANFADDAIDITLD